MAFSTCNFRDCLTLRQSPNLWYFLSPKNQNIRVLFQHQNVIFEVQRIGISEFFFPTAKNDNLWNFFQIQKVIWETQNLDKFSRWLLATKHIQFAMSKNWRKLHSNLRNSRLTLNFHFQPPLTL